MKYTGDTPAKKIARLAVWKRTKELLGPKFYTGTHVVLLSSYAGDVSTLLGLGVLPHRIVGVDTDKHAIDAAMAKYPGLRDYLHDDITNVIRWLTQEDQIVSIFLDFCAPMRDNTVQTVMDCARQMSPGAVVSAAFKIGREKGEWAQAVAEEKAQATAGSRAFYLRAEMLTRTLLLNGQGNRLKPTDFYRYSSTSAIEKGSQMLVCIGQVSKDPELSKKPHAATGKIVRQAHYSSIAADYRALGSVASLLASHGEDAHLLLNLRQESIPAYKAHRTRGTYEGVSAIIRRKR